jgi:23S rRNA-/tRNA-specific pseudouridylate synthase
MGNASYTRSSLCGALPLVSRTLSRFAHGTHRTARNVPPPPPYCPPPNDALDLLYVDTWLLMANKPAGLLSVPGRGENKQDCLVLRVQAEYPDALIVHRLDLPTSGLLLLARGKEMQRRLSHEFAQRRVEKRYLAVVMGMSFSTHPLWLVGFRPFFALACLCPGSACRCSGR